MSERLIGPWLQIPAMWLYIKYIIDVRIILVNVIVLWNFKHIGVGTAANQHMFPEYRYCLVINMASST